MKELTVSIAEAQRALGLSRTTVFQLAAAKRLTRVKVGRRSLITVASIEALVADAIDNEGR